MNPQKLNSHLPAASISARFENSSAVPITQESGDPLRGERLSYKWTSAAAEGIELHLLLGASCFVDSVVLTIGEKTALASVLLKTAGGAVLASHRAESGKSITAREIPLTASALTDSLVLVLTGNFSDIELDEIALYGVLGDAPAIFPTPSAASIGEKRIPASRFDTYLADSNDGARAGEILSEKLSEITGYPLKKSHKSAFVRFLTDPSVAANGYTLKICEDGAEIRASDLRGFVMGVETLVKLADTDGIPEASVSDEP